jgi:hypothetical protein
VSQWKRVEQEVAPKQPEPKEPELMTGADALVMAIKNGGVVWHSKLNSPRVSYDASGNLLTNSHWAIDLGPDKLYEVRPLPEETMSFDEAWECLGRGEKVQVLSIHGVVDATLDGRLYGTPFNMTVRELNGRRFRKVEKDTKDA